LSPAAFLIDAHCTQKFRASGSLSQGWQSHEHSRHRAEVKAATIYMLD